MRAYLVLPRIAVDTRARLAHILPCWRIALENSFNRQLLKLQLIYASLSSVCAALRIED